MSREGKEKDRWGRGGRGFEGKKVERQQIEKERVFAFAAAVSAPLLQGLSPVRAKYASRDTRRTCFPLAGEEEALPEPPGAFVVLLRHQTSAAAAAATITRPAREPPESGAAVFSLGYCKSVYLESIGGEQARCMERGDGRGAREEIGLTLLKTRARKKKNNSLPLPLTSSSSCSTPRLPLLQLERERERERES